MSASNHAATAASPAANNNPSLALDSNSRPNGRRRTVVVVEKKSTCDVLADGLANGVGDDKMLASRKDLSHTIRGESALERSKDLSQLKKGFIASPNISSRRRKPVQRPEKPRWQIVLSVLTKNCLLLAVLLWLGQTLWRWSDRIADNANSPFVALDYEGRISEVEASLKKAAKMLQGQLEVVDKKIGSEIGTLKRDLNKQVDTKGVLLEKALKRLEARTDSLDKSVSKLKDMGFISKEEFESFWSELKNSRSFDGSIDSNVALDQVRVLARDIVEKEIEKHAADGLGRVDYAVASGGAKVVRHSEPYGFGKANNWFAVAKGRNGVHTNAHKMLQPSFGEPGQCFPMQGSSGFVEIRLRTGMIPEAVTLEHVSKSVAFDRSSAPKDCRVSAWFESPDDDQSSHAEKIFVLTEFSYDLEKSNAQTFNVEAPDAGLVNMVRLDFTSNHGSSDLTCIYRFRVHGYEPRSPASVALQA